VASYAVRTILSVYALPADPSYKSFLERLSSIYFTQSLTLIERLRSFVIAADKQLVEGICDKAITIQNQPKLTVEQQQVVTDVLSDSHAGVYKPTLLQGVTGSGKTEVYKALIVDLAMRGKSVIFLCPEVGLARQMQQIFQESLRDAILVGGWHSSSTPQERQAVWQAAILGHPVLVVGVHQPILLPLSNLGLIIIDEEHDGGYEEKQHPRINSKHAALLRARQYCIPIVLGSATPSVATLYHAEQNGWRRCFLTQRFSGAFPVVQHVLLSAQKKRPHFWISQELLTALADRIFQGKQAIVYLNRRGYGFFLQCVECGFIFECSRCAVSLSVHHDEHAGGYERMLSCHYCDFRMPVPGRCTSCDAKTDRSKSKGIGTQQLVAILSELLPQARIARADADVSRKKKLWKETISQFERGDIDILVGTQIITKGFHFPRVTLVGIVWADSSVNFPSYDAHEVALQQMIQVAGRAGRATHDGLVIVQSFENHPLFSYIDELKYPQFCTQELAARRDFGYPPFTRLITIEISHAQEDQVIADAEQIKQLVRDSVAPEIVLLGPAKPLVSKIQHVHYRHILCKSERYSEVHAVLMDVLSGAFKSVVAVHPL
jgi:primosomal protein N' (replication factor Y)